MNFRFLIVFSLLPLCQIFGQDVVRFQKGDSLTVKVTEIKETQIQYKRLDNLEGPVYTIKKSDVESITYSNGSTDRFVKIAGTKENVHPLDTMMSSICFKPEAKKGKLFTISYGQDVVKGHFVWFSGMCKSEMLGEKLMKHGWFDFYDGDKLVMKTKFRRDAELNTDCVFDRELRQITQKGCFDAYFKR